MTQQHINLGTPPNGADGDTNRTAWVKAEGNFNDLYDRLGALSPVVGRNLLINPQWRIRQRGFTGGALAQGVYGYDRWKAGAGGCNVTANASTGVLTHTSGPLVQIVEQPRIAGRPVTVSVADPSGSVQVNVEGQTATISAGAGRRAVTLTIPSGSTGNITLTLTATGVSYKEPQLELGQVAEPIFEVRPLAFELMLCQRYYEKSYNLDVSPGTGSPNGELGRVQSIIGTNVGGGNFVHIPFAVRKRVAPATTVYSSSTGVAGQVNQSDGSTVALSFDQIGEGGFGVAWTNAAGKVGGFFQWVADAEI